MCKFLSGLWLSCDRNGGGEEETVQTPINLRFRLLMFCFISHSIGYGIRSESLHVFDVRPPLSVPISGHVGLSQPRAKINLSRLMAETPHVQHDASAAMTIRVSSIGARNVQTVVVSPVDIIPATFDCNLLWASINGRERVSERNMWGLFLSGDKLQTGI